MEINDLAGVLVSFLYFLLVLALIFAVLLLVEKWGKKHPDKKETTQDSETTEENTPEKEGSGRESGACDSSEEDGEKNEK